MITEIAILNHLQLISKGLENLGGMYQQLDCLHKLAACQKEMIQVARENLTYVENRMSIGTGTSLEVKVARQQLELALGEQEGIALSMKRSLNNLKNFLGLKSTQDFTPNFRDSRRQVLGSFDPATASLEQAKNRSYELKSLEIYQQLQNFNVRSGHCQGFSHDFIQHPDARPLECKHRLMAFMSASVSRSRCGMDSNGSATSPGKKSS